MYHYKRGVSGHEELSMTIPTVRTAVKDKGTLTSLGPTTTYPTQHTVQYEHSNTLNHAQRLRVLARSCCVATCKALY